MRQWPHAPLHIFNNKGVYIVTAATMYKQHFFKSWQELEILHDALLELSEKYQWKLEAWAIFSNHYHFIARSPDNPQSLQKLITHLHADTARKINLKHNTQGRKVWYQFWDTQLSFQASYLARLNYVIQNPVRHKLVEHAVQYPWCSANWFKENSAKSFYNTVTTMRIDQVNVYDDFDLDLELQN